MEEHGQRNEQITKRHKTINKIYWLLHREMPESLYESFSTLLNAVEEKYDKLLYEPEASRCFKEILDEASRKIMEIGA